MAMIRCEECGKEISSTAERCPHCGHETSFAKESGKKKRASLIVNGCIIAVVIGLALLVPAAITLAQNYNDWYFWNLYTERSHSVMVRLWAGGGLTVGGFGAFIWYANKMKKEKGEHEQVKKQLSPMEIVVGIVLAVVFAVAFLFAFCS